MRLALTAFTLRGGRLALELAQKLEGEHDCAPAFPPRLAGELGAAAYESLGAWTGERFADCGGIIFVGASGIAVRAVAPYVRDKLTDPAVVSVDETGRFAVPLLSGHVGGANELARRVAALTGGVAAVSTATDVNGVFAVDQWAAEQGFALDGRAAAKHISAALLAGETVGFMSDFPVEGALPEGVAGADAALGFSVTLSPSRAPFRETLRLVPRIVTLGVGCRRGTACAAIAEAVDTALERAGVSGLGLRRVCTIDLKRDEAGLLAFCRDRGLELHCFTAEELRAVPGEFTPSSFVEGVTGVDNVCERCAVLGGGRLLLPKQALGGVTVALAQGICVPSFRKAE